jgi:hypothetical protein
LDPGLFIWAVSTVVILGGLIAGVVFFIRYVLRTNRRVKDLGRQVAGLTEASSEVDGHKS